MKPLDATCGGRCRIGRAAAGQVMDRPMDVQIDPSMDRV